MKLIFPLAMLAAFCVGYAVQAKPKPTKPMKPTYKQVQQIFTDNCAGCHGNDEGSRAGIDLTSYATVMKGGDDGPIVKPGAPKHSLLIEALRGSDGVRQMPPRRTPVAEDKIVLIENWIKAGAKP